MVVASVVFALVALGVGRSLVARLGTWNATLVAGLSFVVLVGITMALLPALGELAANASGSALTETPQPLTDPAGHIVLAGFDADLLYRFRVYSVLAQVVLWGALGIGFAPLADRVFARHGVTAQRDMAPIA
jgi:hypothetical protein